MTSKKLPRRYWDSCAFLGILSGEEDKVPVCKPVLEAAEKGELVIVTSAVTLAEVIKTKGRPRLKAEKEQAIREFFQHKWIVVAECDRQMELEYSGDNPVEDSEEVADAEEED